ncbi:aspartate kinase [Chenggangzhangella methanolivorans]|uniref:Aspartate kinase n=1 Tax=Chenggangzhangella methanolivorans TaxID=1437009 RepID=A0A9E6UL66_9HYPH|nr:aspartate kinase [Chenggangzhangella methanolivorans]QZO00182.1 aspartate kinase [Chenggangzhangella methanolivorans]
MITVVKFGGSLLGSREREGILSAAARAGVVLVPGGGPFADGVRTEQRRLVYGDRAAHAMACLAMEQTAWALNDLGPDFVACSDQPAFAAARAAGRPAIWLPSAMAIEAPLPASWDVTSDSLALWLAIELRADRLILLKAAAAAEGGLEAWAAAGTVDPVFAPLAEEFSGEIALVGPATAAAFEAALAAPIRRAA